MAAKPAPLKLPGWVFPAIALVVVIALAAFALSLRSADEPTSTAASSTQVAPTEVQQPDQPDLRQAERRDPQDLLSDGPVDAPVGLVVFSDYQCPFCAKWSAETLPLMREYAAEGKLRIEWRDVNVFGKDSERAALASYAAAKQGAFWAYHDALFADGKHRKSSQLNDEALITLAVQLGLDREQFIADFRAEDTASQIARNAELGLELGAHSTPVFLLDGRPLVGAQPSELFVDAVEQALAGKDS